ncbi:MAG: hypothetical protein J0L92_28610 [Deltaproteobacteria bacterium]|nr:hypothetical protein [Deltaproteobacteria bacterium]
MTTVTEAAKRLGIDLHPLEQAELATLKDDSVLAQQFVRRLLLQAKEIAPNASWSAEDLLDVVQAAVHGRIPDLDRVVEGRYLRKRVRELCAYAERYGEPFAMVVLKLAREPSEGLYGSMAHPLVAKLRRTDMVTAYKRRFAILLPRMEAAALPSLSERLAAVANDLAGTKVVEVTTSTMFPMPELDETQLILDWLEDQLRLDV